MLSMNTINLIIAYSIRFRFRLGAGEVIRGWDEGVKGNHR